MEKWAITGGVTWYWHDLWVCLMVDLAFMDLYGTLNEDMMIHQPYFQATLFSTPDALENGKWPQRTCSVSAFLGLFTWHSFVACGIRNLDQFHHSLTWNVRPGDASPNPNHHSSDVAVTQWGHVIISADHIAGKSPIAMEVLMEKTYEKIRDSPCCHVWFAQISGKTPSHWSHWGWFLWLGLPLHDILRTYSIASLVK